MKPQLLNQATGLVICAVILSACAAPALSPAPTQRAATPTPPAPTRTLSPGETPDRGIPAFSAIFVIVMENKEEEQLTGSGDAPYFNALAATYASAANFYGVTHPSLPNYLALVGGDTFGVTSNCNDCFIDADNLASQIDASGRSWKGYMESMPGPCFTGDNPPYAQKHNPFIYFEPIRNDPKLCNQIVPLTQFSADMQSGDIPDFVWITPDLCSDTHDCPIRTGDDWLKVWVPQILATQAWQDGGVLFITYDEGLSAEGCCTYAHGGDIATLVVSPLGKPGYVSPVPYSHYSLLRTIETAWDLPLLGNAACDCSPLMSDFFTGY